MVVFAGVKRHRSEAALGDGLLAAGALHAVHVDGAGACGGGEERKMGAGVNDSVVSSSRKKPHFNVNLPHQKTLACLMWPRKKKEKQI